MKHIIKWQQIQNSIQLEERHTLHHRYTHYSRIEPSKLNGILENWEGLKRIPNKYLILVQQKLVGITDEIKVFFNRWKQTNILCIGIENFSFHLERKFPRLCLLSFWIAFSLRNTPNGEIMATKYFKQKQLWNELASAICIPTAESVVHTIHCKKCWMLIAIKCVCT